MSSRLVALLLARIVNWVVALSERREWIHAPTGIHLPRLAESLSLVNVPRRLSASAERIKITTLQRRRAINTKRAVRARG